MATKTATETQERLADLVAAQGAIFIRELLRSYRDIAISGTKAELRARVLRALVDGVLAPDRVMDWIAEVEAWGAQYVEMAQCLDGPALPDDFDELALGRHLAGTAFEPLVGQLDTTTFPDRLTPTGAVFRGGRVRLTWHARADRELRTPSMDEVREIDGDTFRFKAYRVVPERHTVRLVIDQLTCVSAVFISVPASSNVDPDAAVTQAWELDELIRTGSRVGVDLDRAIAALAEGNDPTIAAKRRRMAASGAEVSFSTLAATDDYRDSPEVSQVANAASLTPGMTNRAGRFSHATVDGDVGGPARQIMVSIDEEQGHMWVPARVTEGQMWNLLDLVVTASNA